MPWGEVCLSRASRSAHCARAASPGSGAYRRWEDMAAAGVMSLARQGEAEAVGREPGANFVKLGWPMLPDHAVAADLHVFSDPLRTDPTMRQACAATLIAIAFLGALAVPAGAQQRVDGDGEGSSTQHSLYVDPLALDPFALDTPDLTAE